MDYRLYFIGRGGLCASVKALSFRDDEAAIDGVQEHVDGRAMELWQNSRYIRSFVAHPAVDDPSEVETPGRSAAVPRSEFASRGLGRATTAVS